MGTAESWGPDCVVHPLSSFVILGEFLASLSLLICKTVIKVSVSW